MKLPDFIHVINFGRRTALNAFFVLVPLYLLGIGFNGWQIGAVTSLFAFAPLAFSFPVGWINDRFSIKGMIRGALALQGALYLLLSQVRGFLPLAVILAGVWTARQPKYGIVYSTQDISARPSATASRTASPC